MPRKRKAYFNWSTGKDASLALYYLGKEKALQVERLVTCVNSYHNRVSMHGTRRELLEQQARSIGIPLETLELSQAPTMEEYDRIVNRATERLRSEGFTCAVFGDINLEELRVYRERQLEKHQIESCFPLWKKDTREVIEEHVELGFKSVVTCVNSELLDESFLGREIDRDFLGDLPPEVDPCGENGEFHTFCYDGPIYQRAIEFTLGEKVYREYQGSSEASKSQEGLVVGFWFCDLLPR